MQFGINYRGDVEFCGSDAAFRAVEIQDSAKNLVLTTGVISWRAAAGTVTVWFRPSFTTSEARDRAHIWLSCLQCHRIYLNYWAEQSWHHEILDTGSLAADRLERLVTIYSGGEKGSVKQRLMSRQQVDNVSAFRGALSLWQERRECFDLASDGALLDNILNGGGTVFRTSGHGDYRLVGGARNAIPASRTWMERRTGALLSEFPVTAYARTLSAKFDRAVTTGLPNADEVDLLTMWPGHPRQRNGYRRLILPIIKKSETLLVSALIMDPTISLLG